MKKVLILTASFGEGHNTAARNTKAALEQIRPDGVEARVIDIFAASYGRFNEISRRAYLATINHAPLLWSKIYDLLDTTKLLELNLPTLWQARKALARLIEREQPDVVVSTYPVYSFLIERIFPQRRPFTLITVVTDSITVNSVWYRVPSDFYIVPNEETFEVMITGGVPKEKVRVLGFPVLHRFAASDVARPVPSANARPQVLYMINSGIDKAQALVAGLLKNTDIDLTVTVGREEKLRARVEQVVRESGRHVEIHGWTPRMPDLLMRSHLLISKAGGATVQEAIAACTPMIVSQIVPGQEEGNALLLVNRGCGIVAPTHAEICAAVARAFADDARVWREWHENIARLSRPAAALEIAAFILAS